MDGSEWTYLVSGVTLDDELVGPLYASCSEAHTVARTAIATMGGTARILRSSDAGWVEVARYTDTGMHSRGLGGGLASWAVVAAYEPEPDWASVVVIRRRPFAGLRRRRR
jgi:hypothetical protein